MRSLTIFLLANYLMLFYYSVSAQSEEYMIESFQDVYSELEDYESIYLIFDGSPIWEHEFQLDFQFPFYGEFYDKMIFNTDAWGMLTDNEDEGLFLMTFTRGYEYDFIGLDTLDIESDVRFSHVFINNMQAFVLQFTKVGFFADPFADSLNTYMNFQLWFFENGVSEIHFGEMHMDSTPIYSPGNGFYCYSTSGGVDTNEVCGPHIGISNPLDELDAIAISGSYEDFEVVDNIYADLTVLPPSGWIIRFKPKSVGIFEPEYKIDEVRINPNPARSFILIPETSKKITIVDLSGQIVHEGAAIENKVSISMLPTGIYFVKMASDEETLVGRFMKL